jgi:hypothetical protein
MISCRMTPLISQARSGVHRRSVGMNLGTPIHDCDQEPWSPVAYFSQSGITLRDPVRRPDPPRLTTVTMWRRFQRQRPVKRPLSRLASQRDGNHKESWDADKAY